MGSVISLNPLRKLARLLRIVWILTKHRILLVAYRESSSRSAGHPDIVDAKHREYGRRLRLAFEELGPTFIKMGQMLAARDDLIHGGIALELRKLRDRVDPVEFDRIRPVIEGELSRKLGRPVRIEDVFESFDQEPIASASIAQVYRARYRGRDVAIKVVRTGAVESINLDLELLFSLKPIIVAISRFIGLRGEAVEDFLKELRDMLKREVDYMNEALNMAKFAENFENIDYVVVPRVYWEISTDKLLVMDYIDGYTVQDIIERGLLTEGERKVVARMITESFLKQMLEDGFFHADPHPSNILVIPSSNGPRICYLDFGALGSIPSSIRASIVGMLQSIVEKDVERFAEEVLELGEHGEIDRESFLKDLERIIAKYNNPEIAGPRLSDNLLVLARKYDIRFPRIFVLLQRALILIEDVCIKLDPRFNFIEIAREYIEGRGPISRIRSVLDIARVELSNFLRDLIRFPVYIKNITREGVPVRIAENPMDQRDKHFRNLFGSLFSLILLGLSSALIFISRGEDVAHYLGIFGFISAVFIMIYLLTSG